MVVGQGRNSAVGRPTATGYSQRQSNDDIEFKNV
jgi:hypothetical protein